MQYGVLGFPGLPVAYAARAKQLLNRWEVNPTTQQNFTGIATYTPLTGFSIQVYPKSPTSKLSIRAFVNALWINPQSSVGGYLPKIAIFRGATNLTSHINGITGGSTTGSQSQYGTINIDWAESGVPGGAIYTIQLVDQANSGANINMFGGNFVIEEWSP